MFHRMAKWEGGGGREEKKELWEEPFFFDLHVSFRYVYTSYWPAVGFCLLRIGKKKKKVLGDCWTVVAYIDEWFVIRYFLAAKKEEDPTRCSGCMPPRVPSANI